MTAWSKLEFLIFSPHAKIILCDVTEHQVCVLVRMGISHDLSCCRYHQKIRYVLSYLKTEQSQKLSLTLHSHTQSKIHTYPILFSLFTTG